MERMKEITKQGGYQHTSWNKGISLRDYFAGKALVSVLSIPQEFDKTSIEILARFCYRMADAMLKERNMKHE